MRDCQLTGLDKAWRFSLRPGVNRAGRNPENDLHVAECSVSGFHCEIYVSEQTILVKDLGSTNGTFIDGQPAREAALQSGQLLRLGSVELRLEESPVQITIPSLNPKQEPTSVTLLDGTLSCLNHPTAQATLRCTQCERVFCEACVHFLRLTGGKARLFCPSCSRPCEPIPGIKPAKSKRQSFLSWLTQTMRLRFR
jgi:pSer/pThr/pTyr-binding forkhead associated (FHA) protein